MKKRLILLLILCALLLCLSGCKNSTAEGGKQEAGDEKFSVVVSIFPAYDWVMHVMGEDRDNAEVTLLSDNGVDLHSYQPSVDDIIRISECDLFIYTGGPSDTWVRDALREPVNKDRIVISLMDTLGDDVKEEELVEGMEEDDDSEHDDSTPEYDEHIWLSIRNAALLTQAVCDAISALDPEHAAVYAANTQDYEEKLAAMDRAYEEAVRSASQKTLLFGDRFPFRYLTDDYGLDYYAAFTGCSAETEASFETIVFLAEKLDALGLHTVLRLDGSDGRIAEAICAAAKEKDLQILTLDSMQSVTRQAIQEGVTYLSVMEKNLETLRQALK